MTHLGMHPLGTQSGSGIEPRIQRDSNPRRAKGGSHPRASEGRSSPASIEVNRIQYQPKPGNRTLTQSNPGSKGIEPSIARWGIEPTCRVKPKPSFEPTGIEPTGIEPRSNENTYAPEGIEPWIPADRESNPTLRSKKSSSSGNRTLGVCVTGRNVTNYTNEDYCLSEDSQESNLRQPGVKRLRYQLHQGHSASIWQAKTCVTCDSRVVPHRSTEQAQRCLTSEFGWDLVHSPWYERMMGVILGVAIKPPTAVGSNPKRYAIPGSNRGPPACEAGVITN